MKKFFTALCTLALLLGLFPAAYAASPAGTETVRVYDETAGFRPAQEVSRVNITLNGEPLEMDVPGVMLTTDGKDARTLVPVRAIAEPLGAEILWMSDTRQVLLFRGDDIIVLTLGSARALVNGEAVTLPGEVPAQIVQSGGVDRTLVPLRFVSEQLHAQVDWDGATYTAAVTADLSLPEPELPEGVERVESITHDAGQRTITIQLSGEPRYQITDMGDRVVIDLMGYSYGEYGSMEIGDPAVTSLRYADHDAALYPGYASTARIVLDLGEEAVYEESVEIRSDMENRRLVIQLRDADPEKLPEPDPSRPSSPAFVVALDAGHGGSASGACYEDIMEKDIVLPITLRVEELLRERGVQVVMTRTDDRFVGLYERAGMANDARADVFVSIHANASKGNPDFAGTFTYHFPGSKEGEKLARMVQKATARTAGTRDRGILSNNYVVLRETDMPACLVETGFMTCHDELMQLTDPAHQERLAQGIARGILDYLDTLPPKR